MHYDVAIIGAGPAGLSFALSLESIGLTVVLVEKQSIESLARPANDGREIALTHLSKKIMEAHGSWQRIDAEQIALLDRAEVIDGDSPYTLSFDTPDQQTDALGYLISNYLIRKAIYEEVASRDAIRIITDSEVTNLYSDEHCATIQLGDDSRITADLLIAADSRFSASRQKMGISADSHDFGRCAILCQMSHDKPHHQTALECFLYGGTLATLPMVGNQSSIVLTVNSSQTRELLDMDEETFNAEITHRTQGRLGEMKQTRPRYHYPLVGVHANRFYARRFALIGDSAVGMHPVTAHGFNLGLSGQDLLLKEIIRAKQSSINFWEDRVLQRYERQHMLNTRVLYHGTNKIVGLFTDESVPAKLARKAVLRMSNHLPPVKWAIRNKLMSPNHPFTFLSDLIGH